MSTNRHPHVVNVADVPPREQNHGKFVFRSRRLWPQASGRSLGCSWIEVPPGKQAFPHHFHSGIEEAIFILEGKGTARIGDDTFEIGPGDYLTYPPGPETAHSITNTGDGPLRYLALSTINTLDVVVYPDSRKVAFLSGVDAAKGLLASQAWVRNIVPLDQPSLDYYAGEDCCPGHSSNQDTP